MKRALAALLAGALFGVGLAVSRMTDPTVVLGFLDLFGQFDPTLALVLAGAVITSWLAFRLVLRRGHPLLASDFQLPVATLVDRKLVLGAAIFGVGWGLAGYCPGPALVAMASAIDSALVFVPAMIVGSLVHRFSSPT
jgi:uncharacterized membrane protein YedE/YeeE